MRGAALTRAATLPSTHTGLYPSWLTSVLASERWLRSISALKLNPGNYLGKQPLH